MRIPYSAFRWYQKTSYSYSPAKNSKCYLPLISKKKPPPWPSHWMFFPPIESLKGPFSASTACVCFFQVLPLLWTSGVELSTILAFRIGTSLPTRSLQRLEAQSTAPWHWLGCWFWGMVVFVGLVRKKGERHRKKNMVDFLCRKSLCRKWGIFLK